MERTAEQDRDWRMIPPHSTICSFHRCLWEDGRHQPSPECHCITKTQMLIDAEILRRLEGRNERIATLEAHLRAFLDFYDASDEPNPLAFFEIMHERAAAIRKDLEGG